MPRVDLNCDLGEGAGHDAELMPLISSANIACGAHAGDEATMRATVALAKRHGVAVGAHPGFADKENFGRKEQTLTEGEIHALVARQIRELQAVARELGVRVGHVKPHGALYNLAARDLPAARAIAAAVRQCDSRMRLVGLAGSTLVAEGRIATLEVGHEVFADRTYRPDGTLTPRDRPDALITDVAAAVAQVRRMIREGKVRATDGTDVAIRADTICLHGDGPHAVEFARAIWQGLKADGITVGPIAP